VGMALPLIPTNGTFATVSTLLQSTRRAEREQWLSPEALASRRESRMRELLAHATAARYYRGAIRGAGIDPARFTLDQIGRLPFVDRQVIAQQGEDAFLTVPRAGLIDVMTSGSTGTPGHFLRDRLEETDYSARWWRVYSAYGCRPWDSQINLAMVNKPDRAGPIAMLRRMGVLPRVDRVASDAAPAEMLQRVLELSPPILTGYAGAVEALADHVLATGAEIQPPRAVFCTAMEVTDRCLELAEQAFKAPAVDVYVTNEFGVLAWSCPVRRNVLHMNDDAFVIEVLDSEGKPVPDYTVGELVVTSLGLTSMPLIRYRMGDMAARLPGRCACGRGLGLMSRVHGRTAHAIRRPNGALITTPLITSLFGQAMAHNWVRRYQVREEPGGQLRFLVNLRQRPSDTEWRTFEQVVESTVGDDFEVAIEFVDQIPAAPNGKLQYVIPLPREKTAA
jgi:phenylacetate-coenzyme A ligase PaaK-like adenylate-forming protein